MSAIRKGSEIHFDIPYPATPGGKKDWNRKYSLNAYWSGKHWAQRKKDAEYWHALTISSMAHQGIKRGIINSPVEVEFLWDDRLDIDNHAAMAKMIIDAMKGYILREDNRACVVRVSHGFHDGGVIRVILREV